MVYSEKIIRITTETDDSKNEPKKTKLCCNTRVRANDSSKRTESAPRHRSSVLVQVVGVLFRVIQNPTKRIESLDNSSAENNVIRMTQKPSFERRARFPISAKLLLTNALATPF